MAEPGQLARDPAQAAGLARLGVPAGQPPGLPDQPGAAGLSGLAKAFVHAGSRSLLVSHWYVASEAAQWLTTGMLAELARAGPGLGRAEALRRSMLALLDDAGRPDLAHPGFWAPFVVVGEGGAALPLGSDGPSPAPGIRSASGGRNEPAEAEVGLHAAGAAPAEGEAGLGAAGWREVQRALAALGHDPGTPDGTPGRRTREALAAWQRARGLEPTGRLGPGDREALVGR